MCEERYGNQANQGSMSQNYQTNQLVAGSTTKKTLAQQLDQCIADLQKQIANIERMKRQLAAGAALDTDISTLREALG